MVRTNLVDAQAGKLYDGSTKTMRIFIALPVPIHIGSQLTDCARRLKNYYPRIPAHFQPAENFHVTLEFLGEIARPQLEVLRGLLKEMAPRYVSVPVWLDRLDGFPNGAHPHVIMVRLGEEHHELKRFHNELQNKLLEHGFPPPDNHEWQPHITLARIKRGWDCPTDLSEVGLERQVWTVTEVRLMQSEKQGATSRYSVLDCFNFQPAV